MNEKQNLGDKHVRRNRWIIASIILILVATMMPGEVGESSVRFADKVVHFGLFFFLSINICFKYQQHEKLIEIIVWGIFFGLMTEVMQQFVPERDMDLYDGIADTLGVIVGLYIYKNNSKKFDKLLIKLGA